MKKSLPILMLAFTSFCSFATDKHSYEQIDTHTIHSNLDYMSGIKAQTDNGYINAIIEIPTGNDQKWEVNKKDTSTLGWEFKNNQPRVIQYLGYPGNYGTIPGTALPKSMGGDGDPLDVIVLGPAQPRGSIASVRLIGGIEMLDGAEQDDKLLAVMINEISPFQNINNINELNTQYPGVIDIINIWFKNYKGKEGNVVIKGTLSSEEANQVLVQSINNFKKITSK